MKGSQQQSQSEKVQLSLTQTARNKSTQVNALTYLDAAAKFVAVAAFVFSVTKYFYDSKALREQEARSASAERIEQYQGSQAQKTEINLALRLAPYRTYFDINDPTSLSNSQFAKLFEGIMLGKDQKNGGMLGELVRTTSYFESIHFCSELGTCEAASILEFFCPRVIGFHNDASRFIAAAREEAKLTNLGRSMEDFVNECS